MTDEQQRKVNNRPSASAEDADSSVQADNAATAETDLIDAWTKPSALGAGRHQAQLDPTYGYKERKPR